MNLKDLLKLKLKEDLLKELNNFHFDEDLLNSIIDRKINETEITIDNHIINHKVNKINTCCARVMGKRYSDIRCHWKTQGLSEYCSCHINIIDKQGYLTFGRYDETRPIINEKGNKIPWRDSSAMEDIDTIINYQNMRLMKLIKFTIKI